MSETRTLARNIASRYVAIVVEAALGLVMLPFNVAHLGQAGYGLWMLAASVTTYFSILDLGYAGSVVRFVAHYRARRDAVALNEILSTTHVVFVVLAIAAYAAGAAIAFSFDRVFTVTPEQMRTGRTVLLILSLNVAAGIAFTVYGGVVNGFQRYDLNNLVGTASSITTAAVNVLVLWLGFGLVALVAATTAVRLVTYLVYRANAYRVFPELRISRSLVRVDRLRELTGFSIYMSISDWSAKVSYSVDALVIGAFMGPAAVAVWSVAQRISDFVMRLTNQLNDILFPNVVDHAAASRTERLGVILIEATRLSLAAALPIGLAVIVLAQPIIDAWVGPDFRDSVLVLQLLVVSVILRVGNATAITLLRGAGHHRLVALTTAGAAVANLALSIALVGPLGYAGVALGTIVPIAVIGMLILFPLACRRVDLPLRSAAARVAWPSLWPGVVVATGLYAVRDAVAQSAWAIALAMAGGAVAYAILFWFVALAAGDRRRYGSTVAALWWRSRLQPVSEGV